MLPSQVKVALNAKLTFLDLHLLDFGLLIPPFWCSAGKYFCQYFLQIFLVVFRRKITKLPSLLLEAEVLYIGSGQRIFEEWRDTMQSLGCGAHWRGGGRESWHSLGLPRVQSGLWGGKG